MSPITNRYLETEVLTAPPQRLRLLLIEHTIRSAQATLEAWQEGRWNDGLDTHMRCRDLLAELLSGIDPGASPLARDVANIYAFLFATLTDAREGHDQAKLGEVLRVLEVERETWRQVCEQAEFATESTAAAYTPQPLAPAPLTGFELSSGPGGFSVDA